MAIARQDGGNLLVSQGKAEGWIVVDASNDALAEGARLLARCVQAATGALVPIGAIKRAEEEERSNGQTIVRIGLADKTDANASDIRMDGFRIVSAPRTVSIVGVNEQGALNGVLEFLERYVGVRWLFPGAEGEDVPTLRELRVPWEEVSQNPAFRFRSISPFRTPGGPYGEWGMRNRLQCSNHPEYMRYMHNLHALFPVERFGKTHPEYYPRGRPPKPGVIGGWQPAFSETGTVDAAVEGVLAYFRANPEAAYCSLGVNDGGGYAEEEPGHPDFPGRYNSVGLVDMSELYYAWVNQVAERVLRVYPDKWFGLLAYSNVTDPPSLPLHPRVIPFVTKDRMAWINADVREADRSRADAWRRAAGQWGWYDYMYGVWYAVPRVYPHLMADNYRYAAKQGVVAHTAEMWPNLLDGPKAWLAARLQWDPFRQVDDLLQEWYERMVGRVAAPELAAFYERWETFWTERIVDSPWFRTTRSGHNTNLGYRNPSYLDLVSEADIAESKRLLAAALDKAETERHKARAKLLLQAFGYCEASALSYPRKVRPPADKDEAVALLERALTTGGSRIRLARRRHELMAQFSAYPALKFPKKPLYDWTGGNGSEFWALVDYWSGNESAGGPMSWKAAELAQSAEPSFSREYALLLQRAVVGKGNLIANGSFEEGREDAFPWYTVVYGKGSARRAEGIARSGKASLLVRGMERGGPRQTVRIRPGLAAARLFYYTAPGTSTQGTIRCVWNVKDRGGNEHAFVASPEVPLADTVGRWSSIAMLEMVPARIGDSDIAELQLIVAVHQREEPELCVYIDDVQAFQ